MCIKMSGMAMPDICLDDPFDKDACIYTMRNRCDEYDDVYLQDEPVKVFLNAAGSTDNISEELREFLLYISTGKVEGELSKALDDEVLKAKNKEDWRAEYMTLLMRDREKFNEGRAEGLAEGKLMTILTFVNDGIIDMQEAVKRSGLSESELRKMMEHSSTEKTI